MSLLALLLLVFNSTGPVLDSRCVGGVVVDWNVLADTRRFVEVEIDESTASGHPGANAGRPVDGGRRELPPDLRGTRQAQSFVVTGDVLVPAAGTEVAARERNCGDGRGRGDGAELEGGIDGGVGVRWIHDVREVAPPPRLARLVPGRGVVPRVREEGCRGAGGTEAVG